MSSTLGLIDFQVSRPPPLASMDIRTSIKCSICHEQSMDMVLEPCRHLAISHWCYEKLELQVTPLSSWIQSMVLMELTLLVLITGTVTMFDHIPFAALFLHEDDMTAQS